MAEVRLKLMSQSALHFEGLMHSLKSQKKTVYIVIIVLSLYIFVVNIIRYYNEDLRKEQEKDDIDEPWSAFTVAVRFIKTLVDTYMFVLFFKVLHFFKKQKESREKLTRKMKINVAITIFVAALNLYHSIASSSLYIVRYFYEKNQT